MYEYKAKVIRVIDGDSVWLEVDVGFRLSFRDNFRLARINAPEVRGEGKELGLESKVALEKMLPVDSVVTIRTAKSGKYGRWLAEIIQVDSQTNIEYNVNDQMMKLGFAEPY